VQFSSCVAHACDGSLEGVSSNANSRENNMALLLLLLLLASAPGQAGDLHRAQWSHTKSASSALPFQTCRATPTPGVAVGTTQVQSLAQ
jgi:hypothetical protein